MNPVSDEVLQEAALAFLFKGNLAEIVPYGSGHINDTFAATFSTPQGGTVRYILQRINTSIFRHPEELMQNIAGVTAHIRAAIMRADGDPLRETLNLVPTRTGGNLYTDREGGCWRSYLFIENATTYQLVSRPEDFYNSACAFGHFQLLLADFPAHTLFETIPHFHDTVDRMRLFHEALERDEKDRARLVQPEIAFVLAREQEAGILTGLLAQGKIPLRVTHNDTKLNNVMIDDATGKGLCVIDLDTVMPGLSLYDFGDSIRFGATSAEEDETDLSKVHFDLSLFEVYTKGYLEAAGRVLTPCELEHLPTGAKMMTFECGTRFLTDYLAGDRYFKIHRAYHNLDRARNQFKLVADMEANWAEMSAIIQRYASLAAAR